MSLLYVIFASIHFFHWQIMLRTRWIFWQVASATATFVMMFSSSLSVVEFYFLHRFPLPFGKSMLEICKHFLHRFHFFHALFLYLQLATSFSFPYWLDSGASVWLGRSCMCSREHQLLSSSSPLLSSPVLLQWVWTYWQLIDFATLL